ncbi:MAG: Micromonas pusilla virus [Bacteroidota bacterium]|jgi:ATP-dependent Clp protease protease subunit
MITQNTNLLNLKKNDYDSDLSTHQAVSVIGDHVWFYGGVDESSAMALNRALHELSMRLAPTAFSSMQEVGSPAPIFLHINSMGGEVFSSFAIADTIERISSLTPVITVIEGAAASGATIISTAGAKRLMRKNSYMLIHELSDVHWGKYSRLKDQMTSNDNIMKTIKEWYTAKTKIPAKDLDKILSHDIWWNSKQCLKYGLIDQII